MVDKLHNNNLNRHDLELILEVNKKTVEIQTEVVDQNETIIGSLTDIRNTQIEVSKTAIVIEKALTEKNKEITGILVDIQKLQDDHDVKIDRIIKQSEDTSREIFKVQVLFVTGLISLVIQIVQIFLKK